MADSSARAERLVALLHHRHPDRAAALDPRGIRAGTASDPVGQIYGTADQAGYDRALHDLGIHTDPSVYGLTARHSTDTPDGLDSALSGAVEDFLAQGHLEDFHD
ncbi:hypothetical protein CcI49_23090 [Frankia sp. CcI49]|uniref:hypothetical protein n=1 Tax=Frankia sp. CcI49 TaxID=1745382 RepID=UPI0009764ED5|nr:hypothetical protein [Frankia sp. CcI49]ONH58343.1 hypothetical protein CcI49_23090 [Frankia sp. CcI49]